jgi:hypothetical protein
VPNQTCKSEGRNKLSIFNDSNDLASQVVYGRYYQAQEGDPPCGRPLGITEKDGVLYGVWRDPTLRLEIDLTGRPVSHRTWADLAMEIQAHLAGL